MSPRKATFIAFFLFFGLSLSKGYSQIISSSELKMLTVLNSENAGIPKDLLSTKTIVVISMEDDDKKVRGDWKTVAEEAHHYIRKLGIDAVMYIYIDDLIAGYDVQLAIAAQLNAREVTNILLLSKDKIEGRDQYIGVLTAYNQRPNFISNNQPAWKSQTTDLEILFRNLARAIDNADLTNENLLIIDYPEFFRGVDIIRGKRFETINTDLRIDGLAIPKFMDLPVPENTGSKSSEQLIELINEENARNLVRNGQLEQMTADYKYKFGIVPYEYDEKKLASQGYQFVLMRLNSSGENVRKMLGYEINDDVDALITVKKDKDENVTVKSIPINGMVYKYYVKHINSGDIYLGEQWDGDDNWQDAFNNHISAVIERLKVK